MELKDLYPAPGSRHARKRVGRGPGSGKGKTAGRGENGQLSRSGGGNVNILSRPADPVPHCYSTVGAGDNLLAGFLFSLLSSGFTDGGPVPPEFAAAALASATRFAAELCGQER